MDSFEQMWATLWSVLKITGPVVLPASVDSQVFTFDQNQIDAHIDNEGNLHLKAVFVPDLSQDS